MELVARWVVEDEEDVDERSGRRLPVLAVLIASLGLTALPPAVALLVLLHVIA